MNKKIKSRKEIEKEIKSLFVNYNNVDEVVSRIKHYLNNISGKELINENEIIKIMFFGIWERKDKLGRLLKENKELQETYPNFVIYGELNKLSKIGNFNNIFDGFPNFKISLDIAKTCMKYYKHQQLNLPDLELLNVVGKDDEAFCKIHKFISNNIDAAELLNMYQNDGKINFLRSLVIHKVAPVNTIFIFFNKDKNIKENTEFFYQLLNKKITRHTIQTAIMRDLEDIKKGKFQVPISV